SPGGIVGATKIRTTVKVGKPRKDDFVRVHPDESYRLQTGVLEVRGEGQVGAELFLVAGPLHDELAADPCFRPCLLATAVNRSGDPFLWHINLAREGDRQSDWADSALEAVNRAVKCWVRVVANLRTGCYDIWEARARLSEPQWPEESFSGLLRLGFRDAFV